MLKITAKLEDSFDVEIENGKLQTESTKFTGGYSISLANLGDLEETVKHLPDGDYTLTIIIERKNE